jgi:hypothetical protein
MKERALTTSCGRSRDLSLQSWGREGKKYKNIIAIFSFDILLL